MWRASGLAAGLLGLLDRVMAGLAERLPVGLIPEQLLIASMDLDVVNHSGCTCTTLTLAVDAQRVVPKVALTCLLPLVAIASLSAVLTAAPAAGRYHLHP